MKIEPIETRFDGHRFRSRLEARYAVMFRRCRWDYEYEPQGFWLTGWRYDYGYEPWTGEWDYRYEPESYWVPKTSYLPDFLLSGLPIWLEVKGVDADPRTLDMCRSFSLEIGQDVCLFVGCPGWDRRGVRFRRGDTTSIYLWEMLTQQGLTQSEIDRAFDAARSARFEHGEMPQLELPIEIETA